MFYLNKPVNNNSNLNGNLYSDFQSVNSYDEEIIKEILTIVSESYIFSLPFKRSYILDLGDKIEHLHPLTFLTYVLSRPHLKQLLKNIYKSSLKWPPFLSDFKEKLSKRIVQGISLTHIEALASITGISHKLLREHIKNNRLDYLFMMSLDN